MRQLLKSTTIKLVIIFAILIFQFFSLFAQSTITLNVNDAKIVISKNIYGHFAEHLGHCIYGGFYVGDTSKTIPNIEGVRKDVITALKKMKIPLLRWPGGCFADTYHGNDAWGCGGNMTPDYYSNEFRKYATFMTDWNNTGGNMRIASGASDADYHWTETIMKNIPLNMLGGVGVHHYSLISWEHKGSATD